MCNDKNEYQCKICKGKIKGAIQTPVTKDVDLAREILDEEQDIALDCLFIYGFF
jgi:3-mercaptopyruvate sulfurtransferase SseA